MFSAFIKKIYIIPMIVASVLIAGVEGISVTNIMGRNKDIILIYL